MLLSGQRVVVERCNFNTKAQLEVYRSMGCDVKEEINSHFHSLECVQCDINTSQALCEAGHLRFVIMRVTTMSGLNSQ